MNVIIVDTSYSDFSLSNLNKFYVSANRKLREESIRIKLMVFLDDVNGPSATDDVVESFLSEMRAGNADDIATKMPTNVLLALTPPELRES